MLVSHAKTAEPIKMPFRGLTRVSPRNHVLDGVQIRKEEGAILGLSGSLKSIVSHCCGVHSKKNQ